MAKIKNVSVAATENKVKINTESKAFQNALAREIKRQTVGVRKGRPVDPNSPRQLREAEKASLRAQGLLKPGRKAYSDAERAEADEKLEQKRAAQQAIIAQIAKEKIKEMQEM
jgi:hypothetical protein